MKILQIFKEGNGHFSANRVVFVCAVAAIVSVWTFLSIRGGAMQPISYETTILVGTLAAGKVFQKKIEVQNEPTTVEQTEG